MGKTLVSVLEVGALVGLQFIPGLGQGVAAAIGIGGANAARAGLAIASLVLTGAEAGLNSVIFGTPKPDATETAIKSSVPARVSAYGIARLPYAAAFA